MGYEGYVQVLCENGHLSQESHDVDIIECLAPGCKAEKIAFINHVDNTNCDEFGVIPTFVRVTESEFMWKFVWNIWKSKRRKCSKLCSGCCKAQGGNKRCV